MHPADLLFGFLVAGIIRLAVYPKGKNAKKYRHNVEYGSARWGGPDDIKLVTDPKGSIVVECGSLLQR